MNAELVGIKTDFEAGRDVNVNDPWLARGIMMAGTLVFYMVFVRPVRQIIVKKIKNGG